MPSSVSRRRRLTTASSVYVELSRYGMSWNEATPKHDLILLQCSLAHQLLPKEYHTKPEDDYQYLSPIIKEIESENKERLDLESMTITKKK